MDPLSFSFIFYCGDISVGEPGTEIDFGKSDLIGDCYLGGYYLGEFLGDYNGVAFGVSFGDCFGVALGDYRGDTFLEF